MKYKNVYREKGGTNNLGSDYYHRTVKITFFIIITAVVWRHRTG